MKKEETLQQIKEAEKEVDREKGSALAERERILRDARREGFELRESLRKASEKRQEEILKQVDVSTAREKEQILERGRRDAAALRAEAQSNVERAVDRLIEKFKGALNA